MRRIAVINQKGGVGKTTTTANLGAALAQSGARVLLIDLDPQAHLTLHFGTELTDDQPSVYDLLTGCIPLDQIAVPVRENLTLVPADIDLAGAETELVSVPGREVLLRETVEPFAAEYDYMLVDCPPSLGTLTINALVAAHEIVIPLQAQFFALQGVSKLLDTVTLVKRRINPELSVAGVVLCMHEPATKLAGEVVEDLRGFLDAARDKPVAWADARIYRTYIRRNIKLAEASGFGKTVFDYAPRSNGAADYAKLADEILGRDGTAEVEPEASIAAAAPTVTDAVAQAEVAQSTPAVDSAGPPATETAPDAVTVEDTAPAAPQTEADASRVEPGVHAEVPQSTPAVDSAAPLASETAPDAVTVEDTAPAAPQTEADASRVEPAVHAEAQQSTPAVEPATPPVAETTPDAVTVEDTAPPAPQREPNVSQVEPVAPSTDTAIREVEPVVPAAESASTEESRGELRPEPDPELDQPARTAAGHPETVTLHS